MDGYLTEWNCSERIWRIRIYSRRKEIIFIPFHDLKLRHELKKKEPQELKELERYILDDIINCINKNLELGNITIEDAIKVKRYLHKLCDYLAHVHKELGTLLSKTFI